MLFTHMDLSPLGQGPEGPEYARLALVVQMLLERETETALTYALFLLIVAAILQSRLVSVQHLYSPETIERVLSEDQEAPVLEVEGQTHVPFTDPNYMHTYNIYFYKDTPGRRLWSGKLTITKGDLEDLTGLNGEHLSMLELRDMQYLRSLEGIESLPRIHSGLLQLQILGCPRLTNFEALNGANLRELDFVGSYTLPDFSEITLQTLCLERLEEMEDLSCLETLSTEGYYQFKFLGLDELKDLSILRNFKGSSLYVPPQVAEQAQDLVDRGNFSSYEVRYPESGWDPMSEQITLLSMDDLKTLPKAALRRVGRVWIAGDEIIDPDRYEFRHEWINDGPAAAIYDRQTGETRMIPMGTMTDLSLVADLTGLWELKIYCQPLTNLEGIQNLTGLEWFDACFCPNLADVSALFTLQRMHGIWLSNSGVESIQGVQNLDALWNLGLSGTRVTDLSPLAEMDYAAAQETGGFNLEIDRCDISDFSALSAIPAFSNLNVCGHSAESWTPYVEQASIRCFCGPLDNDETLKGFVRLHPELEEMHITM